MRMLRIPVAVLLVVSGFIAQPAIQAVDTKDTKLLTQPAISATHIAFIYAGDLYSADLNGGSVRRLTTDDGTEMNPVFSPDGSTLAFSAQYGDNIDVFTVAVTGGAPTRLTWHPGPDVTQAFTPDGRAVMFASPRAASNKEHAQLYTVPVQGGVEEQLPIPNASRGTYSPDAARIGTTHSLSNSCNGSSIAAAWPRRSGCTPRRATPSKRSRSRRRVRTTQTRCGSETPSTSAPTGTASSMSLRSTRGRNGSRS